MPQIKVVLSIGISNCKQEDIIDIDEDEWAACKTDEERETLAYEQWKEWIWEHIDGSSTILDELNANKADEVVK